MNNYYKGAKRVVIDGAPCKVPSWFGVLGHDREAREALKPRGVYLPYYEGGHRMSVDGTPIRVAAHVKAWKTENKRAICSGADVYGLVLGASKSKYYDSALRTEIEFAGDLFYHDKAWKIKVALDSLSKGLAATHYRPGCHYRKCRLITYEDEAAREIGYALANWGFETGQGSKS